MNEGRMKVVILAGGLGSRISEESAVRPKPLVEIGHHPILWHIMKIYSAHGLNDFVICLGYKGHMIKEYFSNYFLRSSDVTFDIARNEMQVHHRTAEPWRVTLVDTGETSMTGGRVGRVREYVGNETFCMTYGDGVCDVDITKLIAFHRAEKRLATLTAVQPPGRFGVFSLPDNETRIPSFREKPRGDGTWINGGYFVLEPQVFELIRGDDTVWEQEPMQSLANDGQLTAYRHRGYWQSMDTLRDKQVLEEEWARPKPAWKTWA
jgi:glucose-1-phosphate cytidylyltransferase